MAENPGTVLENLDRAEKLGLIQCAETWLALRKLRNRMIHEYVAEPDALLNALTADLVPWSGLRRSNPKCA